MKKIALFGGTGQTGKIFLEEAIKAGHFVNVLARDTNKVTIRDSRIMVLEGDVLNLTDVEQVIQGTDIIVSLFGHVKNSPEWLQTNGTKNIVAAAKKYGVDEVISLSGGGLPFPEKDEPKFADKMIRLIMKIAVPKVLKDAVAHHKVLEESSLGWTIVRGPRLTNDSRAGSFRVGWVGVNASTKISRYDLTDFMLTLVNNNPYKGQMPFVSI